MHPRKHPLFWLGLALLIGFALTGQYLMHSVRPTLGEADLAHRMMARANHLYIMFIGLLILAASLVETTGAQAWVRRTVVAGKVLLCISAMLLVIAQFTDHTGATKDRQATKYGCILALAGGILLATKGAQRK